jgi:hypothetical protein
MSAKARDLIDGPMMSPRLAGGRTDGTAAQLSGHLAVNSQTVDEESRRARLNGDSNG